MFGFLRGRLKAGPLKTPSRPFSSLFQTAPLEEEKLPFYEPEQYYPAHIGELFQSRYRIVGKLGYGAYSTAWLCRDLQEHSYSTIKISTQLQKFPKKGRAELAIYEHLCKVTSSHLGQAYIRDVYDSFEIQGPYGRHQCLMQQPMHMSILDMMKLNPNPIHTPLVKLILKRLLTVLHFLHTDAKIIHTDLKTDNLMLTIDDPSMLQDFEKAESDSPSPRKVIDDVRSIYTSRSFRNPRNGNWGGPILCDFGEARIGWAHQTGPFVQPNIYRAPEVTFQLEWGTPVDIWNVAALAWDLFEGKHLFNNVLDEDGEYDPFKHMAQVMALLGPPPKAFLDRSETAYQCFDAGGNWKAGAYVKIPEVSLEQLETRLVGRDKEKGLFLGFIRSILTWLPEKRKTANELLQDPWLNAQD
ncbi:hypothetical protein LOZ61_003007 [Ophidiomyces ophidiicola]|uniref:uncharacterized protein n=1 Tax=Ophidiomyces ophidiicola TaxID=1387563 RepID=UPI0020C24504|nr:uncharacterized protein LOZ57_003325 [Ophidiomyces ophidiicola]KAI1913030.1 hypothetical protein LOZ61_003007 [Ophidiomyces ophidiicola]KAI1926393.1 hypothetical protein LOZ60_003606 [Ophidiomyces ophidiicola]KAI1947087.1 hypothetical protein LOZ57_003325 [Ophidiomyces ophidiicola]KAI1958082.1 hypothetical protein LOZ59_003630 [Ophidiomyces ophidiicola]KAI2013226.1 hypothetical protein LOZ49_002249 [Ophidiomyces ophidiicola]